jgi:hypothetical protein
MRSCLVLVSIPIVQVRIKTALPESFWWALFVYCFLSLIKSVEIWIAVLGEWTGDFVRNSGNLNWPSVPLFNCKLSIDL